MIMKQPILRSAVTAMALASLVALSGCSGGTSDDSAAGSTDASDFQLPAKKEGTVTIVTKYGNKKHSPYFEAIVEKYEKANPGVEIDMQAIGDQAYKDKIKILAGSGKLPDIYFTWPGAFAQQFVDAGYAADLGPVLDGTEWGESFADSALSAMKAHGKYYGIPLTLDVKVWAYNKAAFEKAGIGVPTTFDDLVSSCSKFKADGYPVPIAFGNQDGWPAVHFLTQLNPQRVPADVLDADYSGSDPKYTDPGYVEALQDFQRLSDECMPSGANAVSDDMANADFTSGKSPLKYLDAVQFASLTEEGGAPEGFDDEWGIFPMPEISGAKGEQGALAGAPDGFMVNSKSKQKALAVDFLKFLTSKENASEMTAQLGWLSAVKGTAEESADIPQLIEAQEMINRAPSMAIWLDSFVPADVAHAYLSGVEGLLDGSLSPEDVMDKVRTAAKEAATHQ